MKIDFFFLDFNIIHVYNIDFVMCHREKGISIKPILSSIFVHDWIAHLTANMFPKLSFILVYLICNKTDVMHIIM